MTSQVLLPFHDQPYTLMYHHLAFPMGVIQASAGADITPWLCGKFINACFAPGSEGTKFKFCFSDPWQTRDGILRVQSADLWPSSYALLPYSRNEWMRRMLCAGWYVYGTYNEEHIPGKEAFGTEYFHHDFFIIGYDDSRGVFHSVGYLKDQRFQRFEIPYENLDEAMLTVREPKNQFGFVKYNPDVQFRADPARIADGIEAYLTSSAGGEPSAGCVFGLEGMRMLAEYSAAGNPDPRYARGFMEHKFFMHMRMEYLTKTGFLPDDICAAAAWRIYKKSETVRMLCLKALMTKKASALRSMVQHMEEIRAEEAEYLPAALAHLRAYTRKEERT